MIVLIMIGAVLALLAAAAMGRQRNRRKRIIVARFISLRPTTSRRTDATIGLRDPARPL